jgi:hypothetical protein
MEVNHFYGRYTAFLKKVKITGQNEATARQPEKSAAKKGLSS